MLSRKNQYLYFVKRIQRAMSPEDIALQMTPGIGVKSAVHLLECFGSAARIFAATEEELTGRAALRPEAARQIVRRKGFPAAERELEHCRRNGLIAVASTDPQYPALLRETPDYPHVLYIKGDAEALTARCIAVVGTRDATPYGQHMCNRLIEGLAERVPGLCIVSGLAFGIDAAAHRAALAAGVRTVAVLANPLPGVTPAQHAGLARDILDHGGALVTELPSQTKQNGSFYLARNRIIAALGAGCVVVESPDSGGSLFTAHGPDPATLRPKVPTPELTPDEAGLLGCFRTNDPVTTEHLAGASGLDPGTLATLLVGLELAGAVRQLPGNRYMKL